MNTQQQASQARRELDRKFKTFDLAPLRSRPHRGWIRALRTALGMSQDALGARLSVTGAAVAQLERAEITGGITVAKLSSVAAALDCTLLYVLVPNSSLEDTVMRQARLVAASQLGYVATTMWLEDQAIGDEQRREQLEARAHEIAAGAALWRSSNPRRAVRP